MNPFLRGILCGTDIAGASSLHEMLHLMKPPSIPPGGIINNPGDVLSFPIGEPSQPPPAVATVAPQAPQIQVVPPNIQVPEVPPLQQTQPCTPSDQTPAPVDQTIYQTPPSHPPATSPPAQ